MQKREYQRIGLNQDFAGINLLTITGRGFTRIGAQENFQSTVDHLGDAPQDIAGYKDAESIRTLILDLTGLFVNVALDGMVFLNYPIDRYHPGIIRSSVHLSQIRDS